MYNTKNNNIPRSDSRTGEATPGWQKPHPPPQRPTINTSLARGPSPMVSYAAVAAGVRSTTPSTVSATKTTNSGFPTSALTPTSSLITPITASSDPAGGQTQSAVIAQNPPWETAFIKKTALSPIAPTFVTHHTRNVEMPFDTRPNPPRGSGLQFGSFPTSGCMPKADANQGGVLTTEKNIANTKLLARTHPSYIPDTVSTSKHRDDYAASNAHPLVQLPPGDHASDPKHAGSHPVVGPAKITTTTHLAAPPANNGNAAHTAATPATRTTQAGEDPTSGGEASSDGYNTNPYDSGGRRPPETPSVATDTSEFSVLSSHFANSKPHLQLASPVAWYERNHKESYATTTRNNPASVEEAMPDGREYLSGMNPPNFKMPLGSRVLCIKTDHVANIHASLKHGVWATPENIGRRINRVWEARHSDKETVIFLLSVKGQKCYCGIAIMSSPWQECYVSREFKPSLTEKVPDGQCAVVWKFLKNVSYEHFARIKHPHNKQPIVNMWNGMHFPYEAGREVIEAYVSCTHFTNVVCYRQDQQYNPFKEIRHGAQLDPTLRDKSTRPVPGTPTARGRGAARGGRQAKRAGRQASSHPRGNQGGPFNTTQQDTQAVQDSAAQGSTPQGSTPQGSTPQGSTPQGPWPTAIAQNTTGATSVNANVHTTTPSTFDGIATAGHQPGTVFVLNEEYALVPYRVPSPAPSIQTAFSPGPFAQQSLHQANRSNMHPHQPISFRNLYRGREAVGATVQHRGGVSSGPGGGSSQSFGNFGNPSMQQIPPRSNMGISMHDMQFFYNSAPNYIQAPTPFFMPQAGHAIPSPRSTHAMAATHDSLRPMHSMSSLHSGPSVAGPINHTGHMLRHVASASQVIRPNSRAPGLFTPGATSEMHHTPDQTASPLTSIHRPETQSPAPQRALAANDVDQIRIMGRAIMGILARLPPGQLEVMEGSGVEGGEEDVSSDEEDGGVRL